jgi:hypothetical protein
MAIVEQLNRSFFRQLVEPDLELLALHRVEEGRIEP